MSGAIEHDTCDICWTEGPVSRKYYHYDIKCSCCNNQTDDHFEIVKYCKNCKPKPPDEITVMVDPKYEPPAG